jgi:hypothetical protein
MSDAVFGILDKLEPPEEELEKHVRLRSIFSKYRVAVSRLKYFNLKYNPISLMVIWVILQL